MRFVKATEKLSPVGVMVNALYKGEPVAVFYSKAFGQYRDASGVYYPIKEIEWLKMDEQGEGWVPVGSGVLPKANQKCFLYNGGLFLNFFKFWPKDFNGNDEPVFVDMNDKGPYSLDEITHWKLANITHPDLPPATT